jgi:molybdate transport system ATP-binding protein
VRSALRALGILHLAERLFLSLSYGERRVVLLTRALASRPRLLLLDEVLNGLDEPNRQRILAWLASRRRRLPWVFATHDAADVPAATTHALLLQHGRVAYSGTLRRAPLARWLGQPRAHAAQGSRGAPARGRRLVHLANARVYLDERRVLNGLSFSVHAGEWWLVHGHNGSGKTTLLRTLYGDHGVAVGGAIERAALLPGMPLEAFKKRVGLVAPHLQSDQPRQLTVAEVVQSGRHASIGLNAAPSAADRAAARRVLAHLGLSRLASRQVAQLSYGQSRRVLFARALVREPTLLLLDEPFAGLDVPTRRALRRRLCALAAGRIAVVVTAHRPEEWRACATHELELAAGQARYCGPLRPQSEACR